MNYTDATIAAIGAQAVQKIQHIRPLIVGKNIITDYAMFCLAGLGCKQIQQFENRQGTVFDNCATKQKYESENFSLWKTLIPFCDVQSCQGMVLDDLVETFNPTCVINTVNDRVYKNPTYFVQSNGYQSYIQKNIPLQLTANRTNARTPIAQAIAGILVADEIRKSCFTHATNEQTMSTKTIDLEALFSKTRNRIFESHIDHATVIGCGGIGTYCATALGFHKTKNVTLVDADIVEPTNLNRQTFYTQHIGKPKAKGLANMMSAIFTQTQWNHKYDFIRRETIDRVIPRQTTVFCCTDNYSSRLLISKYCQAHKITMVEAGCNTKKASVCAYIPEKTHTVHCSKNLIEKAAIEAREQKRYSCARQANPSIIIPNAVIGMLMPIAVDRIDVNGRFEPFLKNIGIYDSLSNQKFFAMQGGKCTC